MSIGVFSVVGLLVMGFVPMENQAIINRTLDPAREYVSPILRGHP
ncbi:MAG: hypothetical protein ABFS37_05770 [Acidobacteriota bacterium]